MKSTIYNLGGLRIASDFPLPGLHVASKVELDCDVIIRHSSIPERVATTTAKFLNGEYSGTYDGSELLVHSSRIGRFLLRAGREILVDLAPSSDLDEVRAYLLGAVFGALCHQRGITPLHASAIDVGDGFVIFVGASGAGKSTLVATLAQRGHDVIADDECFLQIATSGETQASPGAGRLKLWEDTLGALAIENVAEIYDSRNGFKKYYVPVRPMRYRTPSRRLHRVYQLHRVPDGPAEVTRLDGAEAIEALMQNVYPPGLANCLGYQSNIFSVCAATARKVPVFRFSRPWNLSALNYSTKILEDHLSRTTT